MPKGSSDPEKSRPGRPQGRPGFFVSGSDGSGPEQAVDESLPKVGLKHAANLATEGGGDGHLVFEAFLKAAADHLVLWFAEGDEILLGPDVLLIDAAERCQQVGDLGGRVGESLAEPIDIG